MEQGLPGQRGARQGRLGLKLVVGLIPLVVAIDELGALVASAGTKKSAASRFAYSKIARLRSSGVILVVASQFAGVDTIPECREVATIDKNSSRLCTCWTGANGRSQRQPWNRSARQFEGFVRWLATDVSLDSYQVQLSEN